MEGVNLSNMCTYQAREAAAHSGDQMLVALPQSIVFIDYVKSVNAICFYFSVAR